MSASTVLLTPVSSTSTVKLPNVDRATAVQCENEVVVLSNQDDHDDVFSDMEHSDLIRSHFRPFYSKGSFASTPSRDFTRSPSVS